jgi:diadenosine tetraphosphate (Ap4A) HIT family hydrolase
LCFFALRFLFSVITEYSNPVGKIKLAYPCKKVGVAVIGLEVPHAHIHLVPINSISDINFSSPKLSVESHELASIANKIANV